jgi:heptaprenyl diphosphate synthase
MAVGIAFQLSDDIMDLVATEEELRKKPGQDLLEGVFTLPVLLALQDGERSSELASLLADGPPAGERFDRAFDIVRGDGALDLARDAVSAHVRRARDVAGSLEPGAAQDALVRIAEFLAVRCGAAI